MHHPTLLMLIKLTFRPLFSFAGRIYSFQDVWFDALGIHYAISYPVFLWVSLLGTLLTVLKFAGSYHLGNQGDFFCFFEYQFGSCIHAEVLMTGPGTGLIQHRVYLGLCLLLLYFSLCFADGYLLLFI